MPSPELERLAERGYLKREPPLRGEFLGLLRTAAVRLADARNEVNSPESRFDLAYNAAHALALAGLRWHGYRAEKRYLVFQALAHTLDVPAPTWRLLARCHEQRNLTEYEGWAEVDETLLANLVAATETLLDAVRALVPPDQA